MWNLNFITKENLKEHIRNTYLLAFKEYEGFSKI